jgi:hypothetical protein
MSTLQNRQFDLYLRCCFTDGDDHVNRQQKIDKIKKQDRVSEVSNIQPVTNHIDQEYKIGSCSVVQTDTGYLPIFKIQPKSKNGPHFVGRWDQKRATVDLDMKGALEREISDFKYKRIGYGGHHTDRSEDPDRRTFEIKIKIPTDQVIYDGKVSFFLTYQSHVPIGANSAVTCDAVVISAQPRAE